METRKARLLIVDDDRTVHLATKYLLGSKYDFASAYSRDEAIFFAKNQAFDLVLLDMQLERPGDGLEILSQLKELNPDLEIIVVSGNSEVSLATQTVQLGAAAYLVKNHSAEQLLITIESVLSKRDLLKVNRHHTQVQKRHLEKNQIIGNSPAIRQLLRDIEKVKKTTANVLITAETGSGKELVARHIGTGGGKPFVAVDSATITSTMAESILFGHEKGAFTGAHAQARGLFEEANGGTIYFDEIVNMPLDIQAKLLRAVQEKEITRVGSARVIPLEFRVICAANRELERLVAEGKFKEDLFQRLNVISLRIPPLRERGEDLPELIEHFLELHRGASKIEGFGAEAMAVLQAYSWPGNIRELANLIISVCAMAEEGKRLIEVEDLPSRMRSGSTAEELCGRSEGDFYQQMQQVEADMLRKHYERFKGNIAQMSRELKISRSHLYAKLSAHRIPS